VASVRRVADCGSATGTSTYDLSGRRADQSYRGRLETDEVLADVDPPDVVLTEVEALVSEEVDEPEPPG
jgi:hypothetical protein